MEDERHGKRRERIADYASEIAEIEKQRVAAALELQRINRAREVLRQKVIGAGSGGFLATDGADLLGLGDVHDKVQWAVGRLIAAGICTTEIEKAAKAAAVAR